MDKMIIIDDEKWVAEVICHIINWNEYGFEVAKVCMDGKEGIETIKSEDPVLVLTDIRMPGMDGIEFLKEMSASYPNIQCIVISGFNDFEYARSALEYGAIGYLLKPIDENALKKVVTKARKNIDEHKKVTLAKKVMQRSTVIRLNNIERFILKRLYQDTVQSIVKN